MKARFLRKIIAFLPLIVSACAPAAQSTNLIPIKVQLGLPHQAVYGGFYVADQNGGFAHEGLAVSFIEPAANTDPMSSVLDGTAQFGIIGASAIISARAAGKPVRALATIFRHDPIVFFSLAKSGIVRLQDFVGKKVAVGGRLLPRFYAMLAKAGIDRNTITLVSSSSVTDLYSGKIDVDVGLVTGIVLAAQQAGYPVNIIYPDDYGVHFYSNIIYATDDYIAANPEVVSKFLRATFQGWADAVENPQAVGPMVTHYNPKADAAFESAGMVVAVPYVNTGEDHIGWMKPDVWAGMLQALRSEGEITTPLDIKDIYTTEFLQQIYGDSKS